MQSMKPMPKLPLDATEPWIASRALRATKVVFTSLLASVCVFVVAVYFGVHEEDW
jgi:hypothetical protein